MTTEMILMGNESFWWYIILRSKSDCEELFYYIAQMSDSMGSEVYEKQNCIEAKIYYRSDINIEDCVRKVSSLLEGFEGVDIIEVGEAKWHPWLKKHLEAFPPLPVGKGLVVLAPWHKEDAPKDRVHIYIEPGTAFGTGYHASTQIALELLERNLKSGWKVLDVGTGSGILALAALKLGASEVVARDVDPAVREEVEKNMILNDIISGLKFEIGDGVKGLKEKVDLITANILYEPLVSMLTSFSRLICDHGLIILSGLLFKERDSFIDEMAKAGLTMVEELSKEEWWGVVASRQVR